MERTLTDVEIADYVVSGRLADDDLADGLGRVSAVLDAARSAPEARELARAAETVAAMAAVVRSTTATIPAPPRRKRLMLTHPLRLRTAAILAAFAFASTGGLAAAGELPGPAQDVVSSILSELGISLPDEAGGVSPDASTPAEAEQGLAIAALAAQSDERSAERGALVAAFASRGRSEARGGSAPIDTPSEGGTPTADSASGAASEPGTSAAATESGGASTAGSGNADAAPVPEGDAEIGLGTAAGTAGGSGLSVAPPPPAP